MSIRVFKNCVDESWHFCFLEMLSYNSALNSVFLILGGQGVHEDLQVICFERINNVCMLCTPPYKVFILQLLESNSKKTLEVVYSAALLVRDEKKSQLKGKR
jgi:hypothetical protein